MSENSIHFAIDTNYLYIQYRGRITFALTDEICNFLDRESESTESLKGVILDLTEASYLDSTNLGLLVRIFNFASEHHASKPIVITQSEFILQSIRDIGISQMFEYLEVFPCALPKLEDVHTVNTATSNQEQLKDRVIEMHQLLAKFSDAFDNVIATLTHFSRL